MLDAGWRIRPIAPPPDAAGLVALNQDERADHRPRRTQPVDRFIPELFDQPPQFGGEQAGVPWAQPGDDVVRQLGQPGRIVDQRRQARSEEHTSELQSLMRISYAVFCLKKKNNTTACNTQQSYLSSYTLF